MPHSYVFGHLITLGKVLAKYPRDVAGFTVPTILMEEFPDVCKAGLVYMDAWPFSSPMLAVFHPDMMAQFCQDPSMPKHPMMRTMFSPMTQGKDLVTLENPDWKVWRARFNPGFSARNIVSLLPDFIEEIRVFRDGLNKMAESGETFRLAEKTMRATSDVIARAVLRGARLQSQTTHSPLYIALKNQVSWMIGSPVKFIQKFNPLRTFVTWNNNRIMNNEVFPHIYRQLKETDTPSMAKTINSLAIQAYRKEVLEQGRVSDKKFLSDAVAHLKIFMLAGHDTTSTVLCYIYYHIHRSPSVLAALRAEHDAVLGEDPARSSAVISSNPAILNQLPYTSAVIKETLRTQPPVGSVRSGSPRLLLTHPDTGQKYPTAGYMLLSAIHALHRNPDYWSNPHKFDPQRWLTKDSVPVKNSFRPFELGPRNCIGQELVQVELKTILAMTVREFDLTPIYDNTEVFGEPGYMADLPGEITSHPRDGMPVRVVLTKRGVDSVIPLARSN
ncbi:verA monooxygenase [Fusarium beomiforme]|uniref:VerA monooxygenase n=1 Tax=Fusarium beomiforme TaxID=44412 RepID=A0A9P5E081_9HYPO|nr:verA monooxygenase [Fusarium beomiforme]